ncbi:MAG: lipopolysaccharide biosynthesis protein [Methylobacter sp.]|nr:lipopolysaccharide biosynthesis protein [Methylobacter sp.]
MASIRRSLAVSLLGRYIQIGIQLASYFILARLLTPSDIGLFSVASAAIGVAQVFREFGVGTYLIQEKELDERKIATAFTLTLLLAFILFLLVYFLAPQVAIFYKDDRLIDVFRLLSCNFLIIPLNSTSLTLLRRDMQFGAIFWINTIASLVGFMVAAGLSYYGYGYFSLVWSSLSSTLATGIAVSYFRKGGMFHRITLCEWKAVLSFGSQITITSITNEISANANDLILGRLLGFATTGIVSRAQGIMYLFHRDITATIRSVAFPAFANAHREKRNLEEDFIKAVTILTVFAWPFYGFFSLYSVEALRLLFGPQWDEAGTLVPWFCAAGAVAATGSLIPTLLPALGGVRYLVRLHLLVDPLRIITFTAAVYVFRTSEAFAITFLLFFTLSMPLLYYFKNKLLPTRYKQLAIGLTKSLLVSLCALILPVFLTGWIYLESIGFLKGFTHENLAWIYKTADALYLKDWMLIPLGLLMIPCWILGLIAFRHPLADEAAFKKIVFYRIEG